MESTLPWRKLTAVLLIGLLAALAGAVLFRLALAESVLAAILDANGVPGEARVAALGPAGIRLTDVRLEDLTAESLDVRWRWSLSAGITVTRVTLVRPVITANLAGGRRPFPILANAVSTPGDEDGDTARIDLPVLTVSGGTGVLATPSGPIEIGFDLDTEESGRAARTLVGTISAHGRDLAAATEFRLGWNEGGPTALTATGWLAEGPGGGRMTGRLGAEWRGALLDTEFDVTGILSDEIPRHLGMIPGAAAGRIDAAVDGRASWPLPGGPFSPDHEPASVALSFRLDGAGISWPGVLRDGRLAWSGAASYDKDADLLELTPSSPLMVGLRPEDWRSYLPALDQISLPGAFASIEAVLETGLLRLRPRARTLSSGDLHLDVSSDRADRLQARGPVEIHLAPTPSASVMLDMTLAFPASLVQASDLSAQGMVDFDGDADEFTLVLPGPLALSMSPVPAVLPDAASSLAGRRLSLEAVPLETDGPPCLRLDGHGGSLDSRFGCRLTLASPALGRVELRATGAAARADGNPPEVDIPALEIHGTGLRTPYGTVDDATVIGHLAIRHGLVAAGVDASATARELTSDIGTFHRGRLSLGASLTGAPDDLSVALQASELRGESLESSGAGGFNTGPLSIGIPEATAHLGSGAPSISARATVAPMTVDTGSVKVDLGPVEITLVAADTGRRSARMSIERIEDLRHGIALYDVRAAGEQAPDGRIDAELTQASIRDLNLPQRFPPSRWSGTLLADGSLASARLDGHPDAAPQATLAIVARYHRDTESGHVEFDLDGMDFDEALQPSALWRDAGNLDNVTGRLAADGEIDFDTAGLVSSGGRLDLALDSFESDGMPVTGLRLPLALTSLWPVESPPGQHFTVARIGEDVTGVDVEYRVTTGSGGTPVVDILGGGLDTLGGRLRIQPTRLDSSEAVQSVVLEAEDLDLVSVLSLITREGIDGEGRLSGRFPVRLEGEDLVIDGAVLQSQAPGRLVFSSAAARETLQSGGDHMTLLLRALQNFHYESLSLAVDKAAAGDARLHLSLQGNNPDVLEGYPFSINIDLQTDVAPLLSVLRQGNDMVDEVVKRIWRP